VSRKRTRSTMCKPKKKRGLDNDEGSSGTEILHCKRTKKNARDCVDPGGRKKKLERKQFLKNAFTKELNAGKPKRSLVTWKPGQQRGGLLERGPRRLRGGMRV